MTHCALVALIYCGQMDVFFFCVFFFNVTPTTEIYTYGHPLSLHDALPISGSGIRCNAIASIIQGTVIPGRYSISSAPIRLASGSAFDVRSGRWVRRSRHASRGNAIMFEQRRKAPVQDIGIGVVERARSEERHVGQECGSTGRSRWWPKH